MQANTYEDCAREYAALVADEERADFSPSRDMILPVLLGFVGDVRGVSVLDAGCGEGRVSRILSGLGARVVGIDLSPTLIRMAAERADAPAVEYMVADLTAPLEDMESRFDVVVSHLVIDDVSDHDAYVRTVSMACAQQARVILSRNNPYSAVIRGKVAEYFGADCPALYRGMSSKGVRAYYHHRTLEQTVSAFREQGFSLSRLSDVGPPPDEVVPPVWREFVQRYRRFPYFMVMEFCRAR